MRNSAKYLAILFALTTAVAVTFALRTQQRASELEAENRRISSQRSDDEKRLADAQKRARDLELELAAARNRPTHENDVEEVAATNDGPPARGGPRGGRRGGGDQRPDFLALMDNPEVAPLIAAQQRAMIDSRYASLFKSLNLNPADLEKFKNLLAEKQNSFRDVMAAARAQGLDPRENRAEFRQLVDQANAEIDNNIQSMLGANAFTQYKQYEQTLPQRTLVSQLDQRLALNGAPLNQSQSEQLVQILAQNTPAQNGNRGDAGMRGFFGGNAGRVPVTDHAIAQASSVLAPAQVAALQQLQAEQEVQRKLMQARRNPAPATPTPTAPAPSTAPAPAAKPTG